jgi:hypothetical protein
MSGKGTKLRGIATGVGLNRAWAFLIETSSTS